MTEVVATYNARLKDCTTPFHVGALVINVNGANLKFRTRKGHTDVLNFFFLSYVDGYAGLADLTCLRTVKENTYGGTEYKVEDLWKYVEVYDPYVPESESGKLIGRKGKSYERK